MTATVKKVSPKQRAPGRIRGSLASACEHRRLLNCSRDFEAMSIYVIDDHPLIRDAMSMVLRQVRPAAKIVELDRLSRLDDAVRKHGPPELVCLDLNLPDTKGCSGVAKVKLRYADAPLAVYSASPAEDMEALCLANGADVYVAKDAGSSQLSSTLRALLADAPTGDTDRRKAAVTASLTKRQVELVNLMNEGATNRELSDRLGISEATVKVHLWRLYRRLGVNSRTQAIHYARSHGLLTHAHHAMSGAGTSR